MRAINDDYVHNPASFIRNVSDVCDIHSTARSEFQIPESEDSTCSFLHFYTISQSKASIPLTSCTIQEKFTDTLATLDKIARKAGERRTKNLVVVRETESEIRVVEERIREIRKEQWDQFLALSTEDRRRTSEAKGLEYFEPYVLTVKQESPTVNTLRELHQAEEVPPDGKNVLKNHEKQAGASQSAKSTPQLSDKRRMVFHDEGDTLRMVEDQVKIQLKRAGGEMVPIPHKRIEDLRGSARPYSQPYSGQPPYQGSWSLNEIQTQTAPLLPGNQWTPLSSHPPPHYGSWSLDEAQRQISPPTTVGPWTSTAQIEEMLKENRERQRVVVADLGRSKEDILQMQEDLRRAEVEGLMIPRVDVDFEAFLRAREVAQWAGYEEENHDMGPGNDEG